MRYPAQKVSARRVSGLLSSGLMSLIKQFQELTPAQRHTFLATFLGWTLDSLDFFLLIFCVNSIAQDFRVDISAVMGAVFLTQAFRPVGAVLFGMLADRYGRRPVFVVNIVSFSVIELACAFAPSLTVLLVLRALFGVAMGGEWGVGAALTFESLPREGRGVFSGILQEGYALGSILASIFFGLFFDYIGWRGLFILGAIPAVLVFLVRMRVPESPVWKAGAKSAQSGLRWEWPLAIPAAPDRVPAYVWLPGAAHDGFHELLARHAGRISNVPLIHARLKPPLSGPSDFFTDLAPSPAAMFSEFCLKNGAASGQCHRGFCFRSL